MHSIIAGIANSFTDNLEAFNAECKRFAALDVILLGHIQTLNWHERLAYQKTI